MAKFNSNSGPEVTENHEGEKAFALSEKMALYSAVCTSLMSNKFYETDAHAVKRINKYVRNNPLFAKKLAVYAREEMHLRSIPVYLLAQLAKNQKLDRKTVARVINRADEITELLAAYKQMNGRNSLKKLSMAIKKGIKDIFESDKFDAYQYAKYYGRKKEISIRDALFLTHPKPANKEQEELFKNIADDTLPTPETWETKLSASGKNDMSKKEVWEDLIMNEKLGYMATLRNLRNFMQADVSEEAIKKVAGYISNEKAVRYSKQLPFRFYSAYMMVSAEHNKYKKELMDAIEKAFKFSVANIPTINRDTAGAVLTDVSASMMETVSERSIIEYYDIGNILGTAVMNHCDFAEHIIFGETFEYMNASDNPLSDVRHIRDIEGKVGYSTNAHLVIQDFIQKQHVYDKVFIFSDGQFWNSRIHRSNGANSFNSAWRQYKKIAPNAKAYIFDLSGYGTSQLNPNADDVTFISGWSNKIFDMLSAIENGSSAIKEIEKIEI
jgi:predicted regulator of amino acid metabolism with ACT domain/ribosomal protein L23